MYDRKEGESEFTAASSPAGSAEGLLHARRRYTRVGMPLVLAIVAAGTAALCLRSAASASPVASAPMGAELAAASLRSPESFADIADARARSLAIFAEAGKVILSPRCVNCHPSGDSPLQRDGEPHEPVSVRGTDGFGAVGMRCATCHQAQNYAPSGVPGHPKWHLAPRAMAWEGRSLGAICEQIKDPARNGRLSLKKLTQHMAKDTLVGWAWAPGANRSPAPGTQAQFGALIAAWVRAGAACPDP